VNEPTEEMCTSRLSQLNESKSDAFGIPLAPPYILNDDEFEKMQKEEIEIKKRVIAGKILPNYKHPVQTEVKL